MVTCPRCVPGRRIFGNLCDEHMAEAVAESDRRDLQRAARTVLEHAFADAAKSGYQARHAK